MNISEYSVRCSHFSSALLVSVSAVAAIGATPCVPAAHAAPEPIETQCAGLAATLASSSHQPGVLTILTVLSLYFRYPMFTMSAAHTCRSVCGGGNQVHLQISVWTTILLHICDKFVTAARHRARNNQVWKLQKWVVRSFLLWLHLHSWCPLLAAVLRMCWWRRETCVVCRVVSREWGLEL